MTGQSGSAHATTTQPPQCLSVARSQIEALDRAVWHPVPRPAGAQAGGRRAGGQCAADSPAAARPAFITFGTALPCSIRRVLAGYTQALAAFERRHYNARH